MDELNTELSGEELEFFEDDEPLELRDLEVETIGLVPEGANKRRYIVRKGGINMEQMHEIDLATLAKAILNDEAFIDRLGNALLKQDKDEDDKAKARAQMAMRILRANNLEEAIQALRSAMKARHEDKDDDKDKDYEEPEEEYPKPRAMKSAEQEPAEGATVGTTDSASEPTAEPEGFSLTDVEQLVERIREEFAAKLEESERKAQQALEELEKARKEARRRELREMAERYSALPDVEPEAFTDTLATLEERDPELFKELTKVLDLAAHAVGELYGEVGTSRSDGPKSPFMQRVEEEARKIQQEKGISYEEAFAEAYVAVGERFPNLAWSYLAHESA